MNNYEEEFLNNVMLGLQEYVSEENFIRVKNLLVAETYKYDFSKKETAIVTYDNWNEFILEQFLSAKKIEGRSEKTLKRYKYFILKLFDFYDGLSVKDMTTSDLRYFLAKYQNGDIGNSRKYKRTNSNTTMDGIRRIFCSFFNWLDDEEYIAKSPAKRLAMIKHDTIKEEPYNEGDMENIMLHTNGIRNKAILEFLYSTACRVSELCKIDINDIDFINKKVLLHGKGNKDRRVPLTDKAIFYLNEYLKTRDFSKSIALFVSSKNQSDRLSAATIRQIIKDASEKAGVIHAHPHRYRVTRITVLLKRGMKLEDVQVIAGHSDINTTAGYNRCDNSLIDSEFRRRG